ncbi:MAG TPA: transglutaminase-like cysteine peptidase [Aestuariivirga sp.]
MRLQGFISTLLLSATLLGGIAKADQANHFAKPDANLAAAAIYGKTLPPIGYVGFCERGEEECKFANGKAEPVVLTDQMWSEISQVNKYVNANIRGVTDVQNFGMINYWTYPVNSGLCHSYALLKKRYLTGLGISPDKMLMTVVLTETGEGHAVLTIPTDKGDLILDNRREEILLWNQTGYTFLKRQSQEQANQWVSLQRAPATLVQTSSTEGGH